MATEGFLGTGIDLSNFFLISGDILLIIFLAVLGIVLIWIMYMTMSYKKTIVIRKLVNGRKIILYDKAKLHKEKDGTLSYKFRKLRIKAPLPPTEAIELNNKGKEFLECYLFETGEVEWITDKNDKIGLLEPFTTNQRQMLQHEFYKAHLEKGQSWTEKIGMIVYVGALVILVIAMMVFYGDMGKPLLEMGDKLMAFQENQNQMMIKQNEMMEKILIMESDLMREQGISTTDNIPDRGVPN